jgi:hypothetical protein
MEGVVVVRWIDDEGPPYRRGAQRRSSAQAVSFAAAYAHALVVLVLLALLP